MLSQLRDIVARTASAPAGQSSDLSALHDSIAKGQSGEAVLDEMSPERVVGLLHGRQNMQRLVDTALRYDNADAVAVLRNRSLREATGKKGTAPIPSVEAIGRSGWELEKPRIALALVFAGEMPATRYMERFPHARDCWRLLVEQHRVTASEYFSKFGVDVQEVAAWLDNEVLSAGEAAHLLQTHYDTLLPLLRSGKLEVTRALTALPLARRQQWAERLLSDNVPLPRGILAQQPQIGADPRFRAQIAANATVDADTDAKAALAAGPLADDVATAWLTARRIDRADYIKHSLAHWVPADSLPLPHVRIAQEAADLDVLLQTMPLPHEPRLRASYALRMVAAHLQPSVAYRRLPDTGVTETCLSCLSAFDDTHHPARLAACDHPASYCTECLADSMRSGPTPQCPVEGCDNPVTPNDAAAVGADADAVARSIVAGLKLRNNWTSCRSEGCVGGISDAASKAQTDTWVYYCRPCGHATNLKESKIDWKRDRKFIEELVEGVLTPRSRTNVTHECYNCGFPTARVTGCDHMTCTRCPPESSHWDIQTGPWPRPPGTVEYPTQSYVPKAGLLLLAGIYEGLEPGQTGVPNLPEIVRANAKRLGLTLSKPRAVMRRARLLLT